MEVGLAADWRYTGMTENGGLANYKRLAALQPAELEQSICKYVGLIIFELTYCNYIEGRL